MIFVEDRPGFGHGLQEDNPDLAVRNGRWKFLVNYDGSDPQLYHLGKDPGEKHNVAGNFPEVVKDLHAKLKKWNSLLPQDAGFPKPRKGPGPTSKLSNPVPGQPPGIPRLASSLQNLKAFPLLGP